LNVHGAYHQNNLFIIGTKILNIQLKRFKSFWPIYSKSAEEE